MAEISSSTVSIDLHDKLRVYRRNGVTEYIAWRVLDRAIDWFVLRHGEYSQLATAGDGIVRSESSPGLWLDVAAMLDGRLDTVLNLLQQGLATKEHRQFVDLLASRQSK